MIPLLFLTAAALLAHDGHGTKHAPASAKTLKSPLSPAQAKPELGKPLYEKACASCHGADGLAKTPAAATLKPRPTNIADHRMDSMKDGEVYWVITNGIPKSMPALKTQLRDTERWQIVAYVRHLRGVQKGMGHKH